jgi:hypothetical protein
MEYVKILRKLLWQYLLLLHGGMLAAATRPILPAVKLEFLVLGLMTLLGYVQNILLFMQELVNQKHFLKIMLHRGQNFMNIDLTSKNIFAKIKEKYYERRSDLSLS